MGMEVGLLGLVWLIVVIWAIIKTAQSRVGLVVRFMWILVLILFPVVGFLFWLFLGPKG
ncbi:MAG: PLDc N-terminal domain-containing protein [Wenzhouxiangellaceae bacterium]|nr:PLDc N-terminal domain-containing protein [Wenzhouxiangellaceae bacterium]